MRVFVYGDSNSWGTPPDGSQPLVIRTLLEAGGTTTVRQLAVAFQRVNEPQIRRMENEVDGSLTGVEEQAQERDLRWGEWGTCAGNNNISP